MRNKLSMHFFLILTLLIISVNAKSETPPPERLSSLQELLVTDTDKAQRLRITDHTGTVVVDTAKALPLIQNSYSPHSYDGYAAGLLAERQGKETTIDLQGERYTLLSPSNKAGDYLLLITREDGNNAYNFNLKFKYNDALKSFALSRLLLNENNTECDQSLLSTYAFDSKSLSLTSLSEFDGLQTFGTLKRLRLAHKTSGVAAEKLIPETASENLEAALQAYKASKDELKNLISHFIAEDDEGRCDPEKYIVEKYYFPQKVGWSNDLGFLFEQTGYHLEAAELLKHITLKSPNRVVAYLNLADTYWAMNKRAQAKEAYNQYYERMTAAQKQSKIPLRVISRK